MSNKVTYKGVDCFKLLAAIGVIAIHSALPFFETLGRLGLPYFAIITSFFFFKHYLKLHTKKNQINYLKKFELRLIWLYFLWQIIYIPLAIKNSKQFFIYNGLSFKSCFKYIFDLLFKLWPSNINGWFPSWYIIGMIFAVPFSIIVYKYIFKQNNYLYGLFCTIVEFYFILCSGLGFLAHLNPIINPDSFPRFFIYIFLGFLLAKNLKVVKQFNKQQILNLLLIFVILFYLENVTIKLLGGGISNDETILTVPTSLIIVIFSILYEPKISSTVYFRQFSTFLYCFQAWGLAIFDYLNGFANFGTTTSEILKFIFVIITAMFAFQIYNFVRAKTQWKYLNYMV